MGKVIRFPVERCRRSIRGQHVTDGFWEEAAPIPPLFDWDNFIKSVDRRETSFGKNMGFWSDLVKKW